MLSQEENNLLTRVGPGTAMGELMRRYWVPAALASEIPEPDCPPIRVKLLGENLVAFRDTQGRIGLLDYFEHSVSAAQVGAAKPDPEIFRRVLAITGLDADQVLHVGDDPVADVRGALEMGMRSAWLNREGIPWPEPCAPPEHELRGLYDLLELLGVGDGMRAREA